MDQKTIPGLELPIRNIYCIGRNFADHAKEMNAETPSAPIVFLKPTSSICYDGDTISIPPQSKNVHHEGEIVLAIGKSGKNIEETKAFEYVAGIGAGIDFTARDIQSEAKKAGLPWSVAKGFDGFAPISSFKPLSDLITDSIELELRVNEQIRQSGNTSQLIFSFEKLISYLSTIFTLQAGDLIFTGTPAGVSAIESGDVVTSQLPQLNISVSVKIK
ncbi:MAG: fumarylacetoacetate hydrolase family protein [Balneolaceae bacterium]|nr:fumarylacetoacetate hydrolase family protein [Balneolaceae bacterium]